MSPQRSALLLLLVAIVTGLLGATAQAAPGRYGLWNWPLEGTPAIASHFLAPATPYAAGHRGMDLPAAAGTTVFSPASGVVSFSGRVVDRSVLSIDYPGGWRLSVEPLLSSLVAGDTVSVGQIVGTVTTEPGHCAATCLHIGLRQHGEYLNPLVMLGSLQRSVLLPLR